MLKMLLIPAVAAIAFGGAMVSTSTPAQAQVGVEIGPGGVRAYEGRPYRRYSERRVVVEDDDYDCRMVVRKRVNRFGEVVVRRMRVCD